jgi:hypothetical protein
LAGLPSSSHVSPKKDQSRPRCGTKYFEKLVFTRRIVEQPGSLSSQHRGAHLITAHLLVRLVQVVRFKTSFTHHGGDPGVAVEFKPIAIVLDLVPINERPPASTRRRFAGRQFLIDRTRATSFNPRASGIPTTSYLSNAARMVGAASSGTASEPAGSLAAALGLLKHCV